MTEKADSDQPVNPPAAQGGASGATGHPIGELHDVLPVAFLTLDAEGLILEANRGAEVLLGVKESALIGQPMTRYVFFEDLGLYRRHSAQVLESGTGQTLEVRLIKESATLFWARLDAVADREGDGALLCRTVISDITGYRETELALRESEGRTRAKLNAIMLPEGDLGTLALEDVFDIPAVQRIMADFYNLTGIGACMLDLQGKFLFATDWEEVCAKFHRVHPEAARHCRESDTVLSQGVEPGTWKTYRCKNNMREVVTPICVGGRQIGNLFLGRFLFEDEPLDYELLRRQARHFGFNEEEYLSANERVPRWSRKKIDAAMRFYMHTVEMVAGLGHGNLRLAHAMAEREQLLNSLRESEEKFRIIANHTINLETWFGPDGRCIWVNPAVLHITGYSAEEVLAMPLDLFIATIVYGEDREAFTARAREALGGKRVDDFEFRYLHRNGTVRWGSTSWQPVRDGSGNSLGIRASGRDINKRKLAEAEKEKLEGQLLQAQKMEAAGQLAGGVAHDFNNLLHVILSYTTALKDRLDGKSENGRAVAQVHKAAERAADLTQQLLAFGRRQIMQPVALDLNSIVQGVFKMLRAAVGEHIDFIFMPGARLGTVWADRGQIEQVLMNLCVNARDAMPNGGTLTIETRDVVIDEDWGRENPWAVPGHYVLLRVEDTGCGMDDATRRQIFEPFFTTKEVGQGTGLGLAMVHGIVNQHRGLIHVESEPGQGATFKLYLPVVDEPAGKLAKRAQAACEGGRETLLVAEDDEMVRELVCSMLAAAGYTVLTACDGADAMRMIEEHGTIIDLAVLDVVMPKAGGREVMDHILAKNPRTRVLFSSAYSESAIHLNFVIKEGLNLLVKPYSRAELLNAVREALDTPGGDPTLQSRV